MSESEQSWSYGNKHIRGGRLLVCAMIATRPYAHWPMDNRAFARAVDRLTPEGNIVATRIRTYPGIAGQHCPDFRDMLSHAMSSCLVQYLAPDFTHMVLSLSPRGLSTLAKDFTPDEMRAARALVHEFWFEAHGT